MSGDETGSARIGPYHVVRHLVSGPGAQIMEAASDGGEQVLLQIVRCRAARSAVEEIEKREMIESIVATTRELSELSILQHGSADDDGETILYWALPWDERAVELGLAKIDHDSELVTVGIHLARRLVALHAQDRLDPLLSERMLVIKGGEPWVAGASVRVPDKWLSPGMRPARLAPEETLAKDPTRAGDVWRLGQALKALTVYLERLPTRVWRTLELIGHPDASVRVPCAEEALSMMEALNDPEAPELSEAPEQSDQSDPPAIERTVADATMGDDDVSTVADEPAASGTYRLVDESTEPGTKPPNRPGPEQDTLVDVPMSVIRTADGSVVIVEPETPTIGSEPAEHPYSDDQHPTIAEGHIPQMRKKRGSWDVGSRNDDWNAGPTGTAVGGKPPASMFNRKATLPGARRIEPAALPRMLPPGGMIAGPKGTLVGASPLEPRQIMRVPRTALAPYEPSDQEEPPLPGEDARDEEEGEQARVAPVPSPRAAGVAVLTLIVGLLIGAVASKGLRFLDDDRGHLSPALVITSGNLVRLDAEPPATAMVIAEEDGRVLGATPLYFQIAEEQQVAVLVVAPDHEPVRVVLPERGRLSVVLEPKPQQRPELCQVNLHLPENVPIESVGNPIQEGGDGYQIAGATVIRAVGPLRGAWLLRCPQGADDVIALPGRPLEKEIELRVSNPPDMEVSIDGKVAGTSPLRKHVASGLRQIRIKSAKGDSVERWVAAFNDLEIEFPYPN